MPSSAAPDVGMFSDSTTAPHAHAAALREHATLCPAIEPDEYERRSRLSFGNQLGHPCRYGGSQNGYRTEDGGRYFRVAPANSAMGRHIVGNRMHRHRAGHL